MKISDNTLSFLKELEANNNKPWFDEHRKAYEAAKADFEQLVTEVQNQLETLEPALGEQKPKDNIFRIFRDVRFSKDKTPYKAHFSAYFSRGGRKAPDAGYYMHIQPEDKSFLAGGIWMPEGKVLKAIRQEVDYSFKEFQSIINEKNFKRRFKKWEGESLKTVPQGYNADNPAIDYLRMKSFIVTQPLTDKEVASKQFASKAVEIFSVMKPLVDFLNRAID